MPIVKDADGKVHLFVDPLTILMIVLDMSGNEDLIPALKQVFPDEEAVRGFVNAFCRSVAVSVDALAKTYKADHEAEKSDPKKPEGKA
jgi:hypothetical protein